jgi:hypothetical protein
VGRPWNPVFLSSWALLICVNTFCAIKNTVNTFTTKCYLSIYFLIFQASDREAGSRTESRVSHREAGPLTGRLGHASHRETGPLTGIGVGETSFLKTRRFEASFRREMGNDTEFEASFRRKMGNDTNLRRVFGEKRETI